MCPKCGNHPLDQYGDHAIHCAKQPGYKHRHDMVRDVLCDILRRASITHRKEAPVTFLTPPGENRVNLRPADVLIHNWVRGQHSCVDITGVSPMVGFGKGVFMVGDAATKAADAKLVKHGNACREAHHHFIPFAFDTFGFLDTEAVELLRRVQKVSMKDMSAAGAVDYVFRRISFFIQKGVAAQLVARLPNLKV
ncbi:RNA helicase [Ranunculus cassubicifolius]